MNKTWAELEAAWNANEDREAVYKAAMEKLQTESADVVGVDSGPGAPETFAGRRLFVAIGKRCAELDSAGIRGPL